MGFRYSRDKRINDIPSGSGFLPQKVKKVMKKAVKNILDWVVFILTGKGDIADEAVSSGLIDHSGQGRDKNGN